MAIGDFEAFSPAESVYTKPGAAVEGARQSVLKRSRYLAQMDQFYASLEETVREFNETYKLQTEELALRTKEQADVSTYRQESLDVQREGIAATSDWYAKQYELGLAGLTSAEKIARLKTKGDDPLSGFLSPFQGAEALSSTKPTQPTSPGGQVSMSWLESQLGGGTPEGAPYDPWAGSGFSSTEEWQQSGSGAGGYSLPGTGGY